MKLKNFKPADYQSSYPKRIQNGIPSGESLKTDILFVGAGPASLSCAIHLARLLKGQKITIIEKAKHLGGHSLSGAVINPIAFKKLFPDTDDWPFHLPIQNEKMYFLTKKHKIRMPLPPTMKNKGFYTASLCEIVRWLGKKAEDLGIDIFTNTSAQKLIVEKDRVLGVQTTPFGLDRDLNKTPQYQEPIHLLAKTVFLADGVRGNLSQACLQWKNISSYYPQHYALGIKEIWKVKQSPKTIYHTIGWPLDGFGGSFLYPLSKDHIALGLVGALSAEKHNWDLMDQFQQMKKHPFFSNILKDGECLEWGAKAIPEGGFHSIPNKISGPGFFILGDAAQLVNVPSLKGIHYAMLSGILAAEYLANQKKGESFEFLLKNHPLIGKELYKIRNVVQVLQTENIFTGFIKAGFMILSSGHFPGDLNPEKLFKNNEKTRKIVTNAVNKNHFVKQSAVYLSGNKTRDNIPPHLTLSSDLPSYVQDFYTHFCPAGVYEKKNGKLIINYPNCIDCKATDILGPWWNPREGGSGPDYHLM